MDDLLKSRYPRTVSLKEGSRVVLRPLQPLDEHQLALFFGTIPAEERAMLRNNVVDASIVRKWCTQIDFRQVLPLLALDGARVVADATLHFHPRTWREHVAQVRIAVDPQYRARGLARLMVLELIELSLDLDVDILDAEVLSAQAAAMHLFTDVGFKQIAVLPDHARDRLGHSHDVIVISREVKTPDVDTGGGG